ncbi:MobB family relaxase [Zobellia galactanivorans]|uniref:MobB family relaxase n=1 Tax=Zobellia galactanivorans (strain DSM 12802 / CCUG 47099 / CIP 106680 / NCIMB 13871 / Dsij) TaxID=63186 RepID=UPI001C07BAAF|nr:MobB family relaxase [Zobellia galactanivorans]MBU3024079.1 mobilization protein [Zobellia galactanivorans]
MYIAISPQKMGSTYTSGVGAYVDYLEKEDMGNHPDLKENFFDQYHDKVSPEKVISEIDGNTAKLRKRDPKFYSIVVSPSQRELKAINNDPAHLRKYIRELMKDYAASFHRNQKVNVDNIKYYAKIEHQRSYRGFEKQVVENAQYRKEIAKLRNDIRKVERGEINGNVKKLEKEIEKLYDQAPHKQNGKMIVAGMKKEGFQTHIHIIVSRKDITNTYTLSPLAKHKASKIILNGKPTKRGFDRDKFYEASEKTFDRVAGYDRNYVETYAAKKDFVKNPGKFYASLIGLPTREKDVAFKLLRSNGMKIPNIPVNQHQVAMKIIKGLQKGIGKATRSSEIDIGF